MPGARRPRKQNSTPETDFLGGLSPRALDVALGRDPTTGPPQALPFRELGRLRRQLEEAAGRKAEDPRLSLSDIALATEKEPDEEAEPDPSPTEA